MLLSICIPTYNRADNLEKTLHSIVSQDAWQDGDCEIVISDNASPDRTPEITAEYARKFPGRIRVIRQSPAISPHTNFEKAMFMGEGTFLKLNNDTLIWKPGMLKAYMDLLRMNADSADVILTPSSAMAPVYGRKCVCCSDIGMIVKNCSYFLTWIGCFGVRRSSFCQLDDPSRNQERRLTQLDMILRLADSGCRCLADGRVFFETSAVTKYIDYQISEVFICNYFSFLNEYRSKGITKKIFEREKRRVLFEFLIPQYFDFFGEYNGIRQQGYWENTALYHRNVFFYLSFIKVAVLWMLTRVFSHDTLRRIKYFLTGKTVKHTGE
jgi:glycosyltransferase involved in cell wall biosynthesis